MWKVKIAYVDGTAKEFNIAQWPLIRPDGVDKISVYVNNTTLNIDGKSVYWCYKEGNWWVLGSGSIRYDENPLIEVVIKEDGYQLERRLEYFPDLKLQDCKLGWWNGKDILS